MINIDHILSYYPEVMQKTKKVQIVKEYIQLILLNHLSNSRFVKKICFIGGTSLRLIYGIDRFSEDLDFDDNSISRSEFIDMTDSVVRHLQNCGINVTTDDKVKDEQLKAYRRNLVFPEFLYKYGLSPFKEAKFLIKIASQNQGVKYVRDVILQNNCGFVFNFPVPPVQVLASMKISALISRKKGRDFYDTMFLLSKTRPDYEFLNVRNGIDNPAKLKEVLLKIANTTDIIHKSKDFEHLLINKDNSKKILLFADFISKTITG
ncbi:MAG: nucleotidyl transferase AbiEii/AbiGii toxin family protein [Bacteroidia bacterium]|nr:nucleotidyl transferase AbiEii/AbiGii toxin family protein [Bacteroidia bacterium]